ncbi:XTP/dITP diphosphatase [archaeon]|nr:XTP/dITP diphosphatase [archaeon]
MSHANYGKSLIFVTGNPGKAWEVALLLRPFGIGIIPKKLDLIEIQSDNLEEIVRHKAQQAAKILKQPLVVEDSGLFIRALKGFPGPFSSYVLRTIGCSGILKLMEGVHDRAAEFRAVVAFIDPQLHDPVLFHGCVSGQIALQEGARIAGFGFDPIFIPEGFTKPFSEMSTEEKNRVSHRARAFTAFAQWFLQRRTT